LAGLWEFPNVSEKLDPAAAVQAITDMGLKVENIEKTVERKHIFTHIQWNMRGVYLSVKETAGELTWLSTDEIRSSAALPTAFRQFLEA
jgi:A/G-specific adenine glycosylase